MSDDATDHTNDETDETNDGEEQADGEEQEEADPDADGEEEDADGEEEDADGEGEEEDADGEGEEEDTDGEGEEEDADGEGEEEDADGEGDDEEQEESQEEEESEIDEAFREEFIQYVLDYEPTITNEQKQCGASLEEDEQFFDDGSFRWRTVFKNTCPHRNVLITVAMNTTEWYDIETFKTYKNDGTVKEDTVLIGCEIDEDDESLTACTFFIGKLKNKEDFGLTKKKQPAGGWLSGEGAYGMVWWSSEWIRKSNLQYPEGSEFDF